jgi:MFS family permease
VNLLLMVALFGSLILIPLYYQQVRREGTVAIGLLLAPQGLGAALALPLAGRLTDRFGARGVASAGMALAALGMVAYTQVGPGTSYLYLSAALLVVGAGVGATVVPSMAAAFQALTRAETPRGTSAINVIQRLGGAVGTALFAIVLSGQAGAGLGREAGAGAGAGAGVHGAGGVGGVGALAGAFGTTFWLAAGLIAVAVVPALLLPRLRRADEANANAGSGAAADGGQAGRQRPREPLMGDSGECAGTRVHREALSSEKAHDRSTGDLIEAGGIEVTTP